MQQSILMKRDICRVGLTFQRSHSDASCDCVGERHQYRCTTHPLPPNVSHSATQPEHYFLFLIHPPYNTSDISPDLVEASLGGRSKRSRM